MNQVGRYQILEELGRGATSVVYRALDPAIGRTVAIKSIRFGEFSDPEEKNRIRERLLREAQSAGILSHPNIVTIYDVLESEDLAYIFMEYVDGASLEDLLRRKELPDRETMIQFLRQIAEALDYAHRKGIVHRDIKPANIMISGQRPETTQLAKIADFGVAKFVSSEITHNGTVIGTPNYMSPEQIQGVVVGGASDQFSLAVMVYELLCGERPFAADNLPALFYLVCKHDAKPVERANHALDMTVGRVMDRALAKLPEDRFGSCGEFIGALSMALGECPDWTPLPAPRGTRNSTVERRARETGTEFPGVPVVEVLAAGAPAAKSDEPEKTAADPLAGRAYLHERPTRKRAEAATGREGESIAHKLMLMLALCGVAGLFTVFIVRMNSNPGVPVQVLDAKSGPSTPPPEDLQKFDAKQTSTPPADLSTPPAPSSPAEPRAAAGERAARGTVQVKSGGEIVKKAAAVRTAVKRPVAETPERLARSLASSDVELVTDPPGAMVRVDGRSDAACATPCSLTLSEGRHTLMAQLSGYAIARKIFNVPAVNNVFISLGKSMGVLLVTSEPTGSSVLVDGNNYGQTPVRVTLPAGRHHLSLVDGAKRHDETIEIDADGMHARSFRW